MARTANLNKINPADKINDTVHQFLSNKLWNSPTPLTMIINLINGLEDAEELVLEIGDDIESFLSDYKYLFMELVLRKVKLAEVKKCLKIRR